MGGRLVGARGWAEWEKDGEGERQIERERERVR